MKIGKIELVVLLQGIMCVLTGGVYSAINLWRLFTAPELANALPGLEISTIGLVAIMVAVRK